MADTSIDWTRVRSTIAEAVTVAVGSFGKEDDQQDPFSISKLRLTEGVADQFRLLLTESVEYAEAAEAIEYEVDAELLGGQCFTVQGELPAELQAFRTVAVTAATAVPIAPSEMDARIKFHAVVAGDENRIVFLRKSDPVLGHKSSRRRIFASGPEQLTTIDGPVFQFSTDFDAIIGPGWLAILSQHRFEQLFRASSLVKAHIETWTESITAHLPMADGSADALREAAVTDSRLWRKLRTIHQRDHLSEVSPQQLREYARAMDIDPTLVLNKGNELVFDSSSRFHVVHLLNEDLFRGPMTNDLFEAQRKASAS